MDIALNLQDRRLDVTQVVLTVNATSDTWDKVVFAVMPAHQSDVLHLEQIEVTTLARGATAGQRQLVMGVLEDIMLHVPLPRPVSPGELVMISLRYHLRVPRITSATWLPEGNLGAGDHILQAGDWHPVLTPYREGLGWQTWTYHPVGDPMIYPAADYDVQIFADPAVVIAAPGEGGQVGGVHHYRIQAARSFAFLASRDYVVMFSEALGIPIRAYYLPGNGAAARTALETATAAISLYSELFGPFPTSGLVIVQNAYWGSMEYSGLISLSTRVFQTYEDTPESQLVSLTAHEVAHQWWYGAVGSDQVHEPWLDEGFAKYSELLYYERYAPDLVRWWWHNHIYPFDPEGYLDRTIYDFPTTPVYFNQLYTQAGRFMGDLRQALGDATFFAFVRAYRAAGEGRLVGSDVFFEVLAASTDEDLRPLLARYFDDVDDYWPD
jgi:hypothetical protein